MRFWPACQLYFPEDLMNPGHATSDHRFDPKRVMDMVAGGNGWTQAKYDIVMANRQPITTEKWPRPSRAPGHFLPPPAPITLGAREPEQSRSGP